MKPEKQEFFNNFEPYCSIVEDGSAILYRYPSEYLKAELRMPTIRRIPVCPDNLVYIGFQNCRRTPDPAKTGKVVGFFLPDKRIECISNRPWHYVDLLRPYKYVFSPDFSCYVDMSKEEQQMNIFRNRLVGSYLQECGIKVIPTASWSDPSSFDCCLLGIEHKSVIAVTSMGAVNNKRGYMAGFQALCERIEPEFVICYCSPLKEMHRYANIVTLEHEGQRARRSAHQYQLQNQLMLA